MLLLENLQVRVSPKLFPSNIRRYLRVGVQNLASNTKNHAKIINETHIKWQQTISIPVMYGKQFQFEIYEKHQFGYNKEEFAVLLHGNLVIQSVQQKFNNWQVFNANNQKVGYLSANIISKSKLKNNNNSVVIAKPQQSNEAGYKFLNINSIVVHLPDAKLKRAFAEMKIGNDVKNSSAVRSRSGELVFIQGYQLEKKGNQETMSLKINQLDTSSETKQIAHGKLKLQGEKPPKKVLLYDENDNIIGEAYVECQQSSSRSAQTMKALLQASSRNVGNNTSMEQFASPKTDRPSQTISLYGILSRSRVTTHNGPKSQYERLSPSRNKKVSVVNHNNDIVFPKQKRFQVYQDKQTDIVSYLNERDFRFLNKKTNKYYRGASVGYGDKTDFTKETTSNPGVGRYHLPSIWDRY